VNFKVPDEGLIYRPLALLVTNYHNTDPIISNVVNALYVNNVGIAANTVYADVGEAAWGGYSDYASWYAALPSMSVPGTEADWLPLAPFPTWNNTSGSPQTAYGYFFTYFPLHTFLLGGGLLQNPVTIPDGHSFTMMPPIFSFL